MCLLPLWIKSTFLRLLKIEVFSMIWQKNRLLHVSKVIKVVLNEILVNY